MITEQLDRLRVDINSKRASDDGEVVPLPNPLQPGGR